MHIYMYMILIGCLCVCIRVGVSASTNWCVYHLNIMLYNIMSGLRSMCQFACQEVLEFAMICQTSAGGWSASRTSPANQDAAVYAVQMSLYGAPGESYSSW